MGFEIVWRLEMSWIWRIMENFVSIGSTEPPTLPQPPRRVIFLLLYLFCVTAPLSMLHGYFAAGGIGQ